MRIPTLLLSTMALLYAGCRSSEPDPTIRSVAAGESQAVADSNTPVPKDVWAEAEAAIQRLSPEAFPDLPASIAHALDQRGCAVPQASWLNTEPHNVVRGAFREPGHEDDWAVLCSREGSSSILVFWGGSAEEVAELALANDSGYLQVVGKGEIGFSRVISVVAGDAIRGYYEAFGGPAPPVTGHHGIDDSFAEKASIVHYYHQGRWLMLQGAD